MAELNAKIRDINVKGKRLRREGMIPGVLFGKNLPESINIQVIQSDAEHLLKHHTIGSKIDLMIGKKKHIALLKEVTYIPVTTFIEHLSFQALTEGERVQSSAHIVLLHKDKVDGIIQQSISEISYTALPDDLIETIEIDMTNRKHGDVIKLSDLPVASNPKIELHQPLEDVIISVAAPKEYVEETETEEEEGVKAPESTSAAPAAASKE